MLALLSLLAGAAASTGGGAVPAGGKPTAAPAPAAHRIDLATYHARRWIVQLEGAPLATYRGGVAGLRGTATVATGAKRLNVASARSRAYVRHLESAQHAFAQRLVRSVRGAAVEDSYQVVLNGLAVKMSTAQAATVRRMRGVRAVTPDIPYRLDMFSTPNQIGAPTLWGQVGGQANAGAGVKVAVIDSGIFVRHDANGNYTGNPCFDDTGYTAPAGYPKGEKQFTNNKVIVARAYFRPGDGPIPGEDSPIQGTNAASPHGTHTAGTIACDAGTQVNFRGANVTISGIAPRAYLMNYRVFYPSKSPEDFQTGNAYTVELVKATEDAVKDGADVISNSWGASYQNTLAWPDPMIQAADDAVAAGVVMVYANGNSGPNTGTAISPAISPDVIGVGAVTKDATIVAGFITVTAPQPVPANLTGLPFGDAAFGPTATSTVGPAVYEPAQTVSTNASSLGCSLAGDASPYPAGSLSGKIALIERGTCNFSEKVFNAQRAGAIGAFVYNSTAGGDTLMTMGAGAHASDVTIPSWFLRRTDGLNMVSFAGAHPHAAEAEFDYSPHAAASPGDVMAGFSSRGPSQDKLIKPDVTAPGVDVLSSGYGSGDYPGPFVGFGAVSGTSMATPHVAGSAALLRQLHPSWTPAQIKSALMTTATENVWTDSNQTVRAGVLDRGAGRIDLTKAGTPGITLDLPSLSGGELQAGQSVDLTINAKDVSGGGTWTVSAVKTGSATKTANFDIVPGVGSITVGANGSASIPVHIAASPTAVPGSYEGKVVLDNSATGRQLHVPVWLRVISNNPVADVLLVDDDGSDSGFTDYSSVYTSLLSSLGISYQYINPWTQGFPSFFDLFGYKAVLIFTGDNDSFGTSGFSTANQNALSEWLDSGGRLWTTGQNFAEESDSNTSYNSPSLGRARLYHGYLGLEYVAGSAYDGAAPTPTANGKGPMKKLKIDLAPGGDGAGNQSSIELSKPMPDNDTYEAADTMTPFFVATKDDVPGGKNGISFGRSSEPSLKEPRREYLYRSVSMGFGLEGVDSNTGFATRQQVAQAAWQWLTDTISFGELSATPKKPGHDATHVVLTATPSSSVGADFKKFRWDFGDDHHGDSNKPTADHKYKEAGDYVVRVEATDDLGHTAIGTQTVHIGG
jgi:subtilisin family serine protease